MAQGPGKYDPEATKILLDTGAESVIVAVIGGNRGHGFSVTSKHPDAAKQLPAILRSMADQIEGVN